MPRTSVGNERLIHGPSRQRAADPRPDKAAGDIRQDHQSQQTDIDVTDTISRQCPGERTDRHGCHRCPRRKAKRVYPREGSGENEGKRRQQQQTASSPKHANEQSAGRTHQHVEHVSHVFAALLQEWDDIVHDGTPCKMGDNRQRTRLRAQRDKHA
jgi:hypothetical protein